MPVRQFAILFGLFAICLAIVGIAWAAGSELYLYLPSRRVGRPPSHPGVIFAVLAVIPFLTFFLRQNGVYTFVVLTAGVLLGTGVGHFAFGWTPTWSQHLLSLAMIGTSVYAWGQKSYFED